MGRSLGNGGSIFLFRVESTTRNPHLTTYEWYILKFFSENLPNATYSTIPKITFKICPIYLIFSYLILTFFFIYFFEHSFKTFLKLSRIFLFFLEISKNKTKKTYEYTLDHIYRCHITQLVNSSKKDIQNFKLNFIYMTTSLHLIAHLQQLTTKNTEHMPLVDPLTSQKKKKVRKKK